MTDNRVNQETDWDIDLPTFELNEDASDLGLTGFDDDELSKVLAEEMEGLTDEEDIPEVPDDPVSVPGDAYEIGGQRPMYSDALQREVIDKLAGDQRVGMTFSDPAYNVN